MSELLARFPVRHDAYKQQCEFVLYGGRSSSDYSQVPGGSGVSDKVGNKAVLMVTLTEELKRLRRIRQWIDERLPVRDRRLLLLIWQGFDDWNHIGQRLNLPAEECERRWNLISVMAERYCRGA